MKKPNRIFSITTILIFSLLFIACKADAETIDSETSAAVTERLESEIVATETIAQPTIAQPTPKATTAVPTPISLPDLSGETVTFWHIWGSGARGEAMTAIIDEFNAANQWGITVEPVDMGFYPQIEDAMYAGMQSGELPDAVIGYANALASWHNMGIMTNLNTYFVDELVGFTSQEQVDFFPGTLSGAVNPTGERIGLPLSQSSYVLFYNLSWAQALGFDLPPQNTQELRQQACAAAAATAGDTGGIVLYPGASYVMPWIYAFGDDALTEDGLDYDFTTTTLHEVAQFWKTLWDEDCAFATETYPNPEFATRQALFVMSSSAGLPHQTEAMVAAGSSDVWTVLPFLGPDGAQAVNAASQYAAVVNNSPERALAAWLFLRYFTTPEVQARWVAAGDYYPVRMSAVDLLKSYAKEHPQWLAGLELLDYGHAEPAMPSWGAVRSVVQDTFDAILTGAPEEIPVHLIQLNDLATEIKAQAGP
ncbi:MAG: extracellular solute-binding protein [Anaerolineae bacterium]|nr:extracellular solute-binding protein [Anaerolineae bacterium]